MRENSEFRNKITMVAAVLGTALCATANAAPPAVSNLSAAVRPGTTLVDIRFDVSDAEGDRLDISVKVTTDGGGNFAVPVSSLSAGDNPGYPAITFEADETQKTGLQIVWDAGADWSGNLSETTQVRVTADDNSAPPAPPAGMALIPEGEFLMGQENGNSNEVPVHSVFISDFYLDKTEVSKTLWDQVYTWALDNGYEFENAGMGVADDHPVIFIDWYDSVKWCNARSEMEGLNPAYHVNQNRTTDAVYRTGKLDLAASDVNWDADGYRLPTESEWERAARGGQESKLFPWGDEATGADCNFLTSGDAFDDAEIATTPVGHYDGSQLPAGPDRANGYGLYDMAGNVWEWCWDWYSDTSYEDPGATLPDTRGLPQGGMDGELRTDRVMHSGSWNFPVIDSRVGVRLCPRADNQSAIYGFRPARSIGFQNFAQSPEFVLDTGGDAPPPFVISSIDKTLTQTVIEWTSVPGVVYDIEYSTNFDSDTWQTLNNEPIAAARTSTTFTDGDLSRLRARASYYRVAEH